MKKPQLQWTRLSRNKHRHAIAHSPVTGEMLYEVFHYANHKYELVSSRSGESLFVGLFTECRATANLLYKLTHK